jgi:hypothetical protein
MNPMSPLLAHAVEVWTSFYSNHAALRTLVGFAHVGGLVGGGGCAIAADRATLALARRGADARAADLTAVRGAHRVVLAGLLAVAASGVLLFAADVDTFLHSRFFWLKMGLVGVLLANGWVLRRAGDRAAGGDARAWRVLARAAAASVALWFLTTLAGAALPNIG